MTLHDFGFTTTSMYGHYNAYACYEMKDGSWKLYRHTFTDAEFFDKMRDPDKSYKQYQKEAVRMARKDPHPTKFNCFNRPGFREFTRAFHF